MSHRIKGFAFVAAMLAPVFPLVTCRADAPEIASFKGKGTPLNWVALSADGSRVATARVNWTVGKNGKTVIVPAEVAIWDVNGGTQVSTFKGPGADFTYVEFSADGGSLLTVNNGIEISMGSGIKLSAALVARSSRAAYHVWGVETGKMIGSPVLPPPGGEYTTVALSPDGKYLATVNNAREVTVWDVARKKPSWRLPASTHMNRVTDSLAFSPDGKRLAVYMSGSGGPSSLGRGASPNRDLFKSLKMLSLVEGEVVPRVVFEKTGLADGSITWNLGGQALIVRNNRTIQTLDSSTGERREETISILPFLEVVAASLRGVNLPPQPPKMDRDDVPRDGWYEHQVALSADGTRLASHFVYRATIQRQAPRENYVVFWDVASRRVLGALRLPDEAFGPGPSGGPDLPAGYNSLTGYSVTRIALSGDGQKLAVSDLVGGARVYDVLTISGVTRVKPGNGPPSHVTPPTHGDAKSARESYESDAKLARTRLLGQLDQSIQAAKSNAAARKSGAAQIVERLKAERLAFVKHGAIPWSEHMRSGTERYLQAMGDARALVISSFAPSPVPDDLRELIDNEVIAKWNHQVAEQPEPSTITLYSSGKVNSPAGDDTWSYINGRLTLRRKDPKAPGGFWVDTCFVSSNGRNYEGANQLKAKCTGKLVKGD